MREARQVGHVQAGEAACSQAAITRLWIEASSTTPYCAPELIRPRSLNITANKTLESSIQIGKIIAAGLRKRSIAGRAQTCPRFSR